MATKSDREREEGGDAMNDQEAFDQLVTMIHRRVNARIRAKSTRHKREQKEVQALWRALRSMEFESRGGPPDDFLDIPRGLKAEVDRYLEAE